MTMSIATTPCPFCHPDPDRVFYQGRAVFALWDRFPVSPGHALLVTRRHIETWFDATRDEHAELLSALAIAREAVLAQNRPHGFNVGINIGEAAGQTIRHLHVHLIPRYQGDVDDPRGGVRYVIPARANYLEAEAKEEPDRVADRPLATLYGSPLVGGGGDADPFLPHILQHLDEAERADFLSAFVLESGVAQIERHLRDLLDRKGRLRLLTGDTLGITEPTALLRLLDLQQGTEGTLDVRIFVSEGRSFHPKAYLFHGRSSVAYVGSSNLSATALTEGIEWNYRIVPGTSPGFDVLAASFERLFHHPRTVPLDASWIADYRKRRPERPLPPDFTPEPPRPIPEPHEIQREALEALVKTREDGNAAGLVPFQLTLVEAQS
jgi:diadenosine tetraphosphate (Ap4A) HIT family hydrolase/HKD family nuclease